MTFYAFGLNHETAPVEVREVFALDEDAKRRLYQEIATSAELIVLSTCNRTEAYLYGTQDDVEAVQAALAQAAGRPWPAYAAFLKQDEAAVRHVLHVAAGLKSLVLGDAQILNQVKDAYRLAVEEDRVDTVLHRLMHSAFRAAKGVVSQTSLSSGAVSVSSAAVAMARVHFEDVASMAGLEGRHVLLVGTGRMGRLALQALISHRPASLSVTNRSAERAQEVAATVGATVVPWEARHAAACAADVVIVATGAAEPVLRADQLPARAADAPQALLIDIAVPRNVDRAVDALPGYAVRDLDALNAWMEHAQAVRQSEVPQAERICEEAMSEFVAWVFHQQALQPAIQAIRHTFEEIRTQEIERHHHRFAEVDQDELDRLTRSIMQKLLAVPIVRLKSVDPESIDFVHGIRLLASLFSRPDCDDADEAGAALRCPLHEQGGAISDPLGNASLLSLLRGGDVSDTPQS